MRSFSRISSTFSGCKAASQGSKQQSMLDTIEE
jgi:hypothetical protein